VDEAGVALNQRQDALIERCAVGAVTQLDAGDQLSVLCQQFVDRQGSKAGVGRRVRAAGMASWGFRETFAIFKAERSAVTG